MNFRKITSAVLAAVLSAGMLAGCGSSSTAASTASSTDAGTAAAASGEKQTVTLWATGSDNVRAIFETLTEDFNNNSEYKDQYQVELQFMLSGTGTQSMTDMLVAAYQGKQKDTDFDIVDLGGDDLSKIVAQIGEESLEKLDETKVPNRKNIKSESALATDYTQAYRGTTVILAYDSEKVPNPPKTMDELVEWMKANPGRFVYNTPGTGGAGDSFARTAVYNFIDDASAMTSDDPKWEEQWNEGFEFLKEINPYMYQSGGTVVYPNKNQGALDLLNQGEIDMCPMWADMVLSQRNAGQIKDSIKITQISPAFTGSLQTLAVPTIGSHKEGAYAFMNYMCSDAAQQILVSQMAAIPLVDTANLDMKGFEDVQNLDVSSFRVMSIGTLSTDFNQKWDDEIASLN